MFNQIGYGPTSAVQPDEPDPRDFPFEALDQEVERLTSVRSGLPRLARQALDEWKKANKRLEIRDEAWCEHFREITDTSWHQRGEECTGFALATIADYHFRRRFLRKHRLDARAWSRMPRADREKLTVSRRMMYEMAQVYDRRTWRHGSTLRGALKGWTNSGVASATTWPYEPDDEDGAKQGTLSLKRVIDSVGRPGAYYLRIHKDSVAEMKRSLALNYPLFVNARLHIGWYDLYLPATDRPLNSNRGAASAGKGDHAKSDGVHIPNATIARGRDDKMRRGHAFVIVGYCDDGWLIHNSWGPHWGEDGYAVLPYEDWALNGTDVWFVFPPAHRTKREVREARFIESEIAREDERLAVAEARLTESESALAIAVATEGTPAGDDPAEDVDAARQAVTSAREAIVSAGDAIASSTARAELHRDMWRHVITVDDDGRLLPPGTKYGLNSASLMTLLWMFRRQSEEWATRRLAIFADAGYWSPTTAIERLRPLRDALVAKQIYPIFLVWDTPWMADMQGWLYGNADLRPDADLDRRSWYLSRPSMLANAAEFPAPTMWKHISNRANSACADGGAARLLADGVHYNRTKKPFEVHLVGYGAGDLLLPGLAPLLPPIASCNLWAPATTMKTFRNSYGPMLDAGHIGRLTVQALDETLERKDQIGPVQGSLLQLVSDVLAVEGLNVNQIYDDLSARGFTAEPEPVLGLEHFLTSDPEIERLRTLGRLDVEIIRHERAREETHVNVILDERVVERTIADIRADPPDVM